MLEGKTEAMSGASNKRKESSECGDTGRRKGIAECKTDRKLAKMPTALTAALRYVSQLCL